ncbi:hypothetical protein ACFL0D_08085, partial [Thermoproteota archaeon]
MVSINALISTLMAGFVLGSIYTMMALGMNLIWGTTNVFNFAHGSMAAIGAYMGWTLLARAPIFGTNFLIVIPITIAFTFLIGIVLYYSAILPVINRDDFIT